MTIITCLFAWSSTKTGCNFLLLINWYILFILIFHIRYCNSNWELTNVTNPNQNIFILIFQDLALGTVYMYTNTMYLGYLGLSIIYACIVAATGGLLATLATTSVFLVQLPCRHPTPSRARSRAAIQSSAAGDA